MRYFRQHSFHLRGILQCQVFLPLRTACDSCQRRMAAGVLRAGPVGVTLRLMSDQASRTASFTSIIVPQNRPVEVQINGS